MASVSKIQRVALDELVPYENNAKIHNKKQIEKLKQSIDQFGFLTPVLIDKDKNIIAGHGRTMAAKELGLDKIPCVYIDGLSEKEKKAYILADNRLSEFGEWDYELLSAEIDELQDIDADMLDFDIPDEDDEGDLPLYYGDERERTFNYYNLRQVQSIPLTADKWQMPIIEPTDYVPKRLIGFNYAKSSKEKACGLHCFIDDYQFERLWNDPEKYIEVLKEYDCFLSPDFSLYTEMPIPMKVWNVYRSRMLGAFYQQHGITVIPTMSWCEKETYTFCFKGVKGGTVAVSTIGVKDEALPVWQAGMDEMIKQCKPSHILVYGGKVEYDYKGIDHTYYDNEVTERWQ